MPLKIIQITPNFPPMIGGVADYASIMSNFFTSSGCEVKTIVASSNFEWNYENDKNTIWLNNSEGKHLAEVLSSLGIENVVLHFSGYGYAPRGLCNWLVSGLSLWKKSCSSSRLITIFHELYATGPLWRSSFWTSNAQKRIASTLAFLSDLAVTTSQSNYDKLKSMSRELPIKVLPVFSNVGELKFPDSLQNRKPLAILFGGSGRRKKVYDALARQMKSLAKAFELLGIKEVIDIGPRIDVPLHLAGYTVRTLGSIPPQEVSNWLSCARVGLLDYPVDVLTKSSIAAAYFAHGLLVVNTNYSGHLSSSLKDGQEFISLNQFEKRSIDPQFIATNGWKWYQPHDLETSLQSILRFCFGENKTLSSWDY
jgi:hypothetical protein